MTEINGLPADHLLAVSDRELATILAALRLFQHTVFLPPGVTDVATNDGEFVLMNDDEIDKLCEDLNQ